MPLPSDAGSLSRLPVFTTSIARRDLTSVKRQPMRLGA